MIHAAAKRLAIACVALLTLLVLASVPHAASSALSEAPVPRNTTAGDLLLLLKDSISNWDEAATDFQGWKGDVSAACTWTGVVCNSNNDVISLNLSKSGFVALLPRQLIQLTALVSLDLSSNKFFGALPVSWGVESFTSLQTLNLAENLLTGSLPAAWGGAGRFPALTSLQLAANEFTGGLPATWANPRGLGNLQQLDLSQNRLSGSLAGSWGGKGAFANLTALNLSSNSISGTLPRSWGGSSFTSLVQLTLSNNSIGGVLPNVWAANGNWQMLARLRLDDNNLKGTIPASWFNATAFPDLAAVVLRPGNDEICGVLPAAMGFAVLSKSAVGKPTALTGTLGTCATACGGLKTSGNMTNLFGIAAEAGVAIRDLLFFNPGIDTGKPVVAGTTLVRPCYAGSPPSYLGANIAFQQAVSQSSTVKKGYASAAVAFSAASSIGRQCSQTSDGTQAAPAWWRVDLGMSTDIAGLVLASQTAMSDLRILVGDSTEALANKECAVGVQIVANSTFSQICSGRGRFITVTRVGGEAVSLCGVEVFPVAANAAIAKTVTTSSGGGVGAVDGIDSSCATAEASAGASSPWLAVDLGYRGQLAAVGVDLGSNDVTQLSLRVGNKVPVTGTENEACQPSVSNLPGYSKTLFTCTLTGRYITVLATNAAMVLDVCLVTAFLQEAPTQELLAISPSSELTVDLGPTVTNPEAIGSILPAPAPDTFDFAPGDIVNLGFRLVLIGPYVVEFDGKEVAVVNALNVTLRPVDPVSIQITSYTVGAPVPNFDPSPPPPRARARRLASSYDDHSLGPSSLDAEEVDELLPPPPALFPRRTLQQQVSEGAVIINVVVRTTAVKQDETTLLLQNAVTSGNFTQALSDAGLQASATRFSVVPLDAAQLPVPESISGSGSGGSIVSPSGPGSGAPPDSRRRGSSVNGAAIGGAIGGAFLVLLLGTALVWCVMRLRQQRHRQQAVAVSGGKADVESGSETSSSRSGGRDSNGKAPGCWPFSAARSQLAAGNGHKSGTDSPGSHMAEGDPKTFLTEDAYQGPEGNALKANGSHANTGGKAIYAHAHSDGLVAASPITTADNNSVEWGRGIDATMAPTRADSHQLLLPSAALTRSSNKPIATSGWETPLGLGPGDPLQGSIGAFLSPQQQMDIGRMGSLGNLGLMTLGTQETNVSDLLGPNHVAEGQNHVVAEEHPPQRWTSTSAELWPITYQELTFLKQIGEGSFGRVYMARWRETTVAVKVLHRQSSDHQDEDLPLDPCPSAGSPDPILCALQKEAGIMASVRHPNVISYLGVCAEPACIVTEYCSKGSLTDVLRRGRASLAHAATLDWPRRLNMAMDAAKGMLHLHLCDPPIIHRDLKSPNLLVDKHWRLKVCDFNLSRVMEESVVLSSMVASNPRWLAPEILAGLPYTVAADVYSFGIIMWELLTWEVPWSQQNTWQVHAMVTVEHLRPDLPESIASTPGGTFSGMQEYLELMSDCWSQDPEDRPEFEIIIGRLRRMLAVESIGTRHAAAANANSESPKHQSNGGNAATASAPRLGGGGPLASL